MRLGAEEDEEMTMCLSDLHKTIQSQEELLARHKKLMAGEQMILDQFRDLWVKRKVLMSQIDYRFECLSSNAATTFGERTAALNKRLTTLNDEWVCALNARPADKVVKEKIADVIHAATKDELRELSESFDDRMRVADDCINAMAKEVGDKVRKKVEGILSAHTTQEKFKKWERMEEEMREAHVMPQNKRELQRHLNAFLNM